MATTAEIDAPTDSLEAFRAHAREWLLRHTDGPRSPGH